MTYRIGIRNSGGAPDAAPGLGSLAGSPREQSDVQDELATELGHARAASSFFTRLCYVARMTPSGVHAVNWRGEAWCAKQWQQHIRPGGFGEVQFYAGLVQFLLEMDLGTEDRGRTEAKMERYRVLARGMTAPDVVLFCFPSEAREASARLALGGTAMPVATATPDRHLADPLGAIWLPLDSDRRVGLIDFMTWGRL